MPVDEQTARNNWLVISGKTGKVDKLREMLAQGADVNATDGYGTALMYAAHRGHLEYVQAIVDLGADLARASSEGKTAVQYAAEAGHAPIVAFLVSRGAVHETFQELEALRAALAEGLDPNTPDAHGVTPLLRAVDAGDEDRVALLLQHGVDPRAATRHGYTPLMLAVYKAPTPIVERLFQAGATLPDDPVLLPARDVLVDSDTAAVIDRHNPVPFDALWDRRIRVDMTELPPEPFTHHPFWETCADEHDADHIVRPVPFLEPLDHPTIGYVRVELTLADGTRHAGLASFDGFADPAWFPRDAQPGLWVGAEWLSFYEGYSPPDRQRIDDAYRLLARTPDQVFPIRVRSAVELEDQPREGTIDGFAWVDRGADGAEALRTVR